MTPGCLRWPERLELVLGMRRAPRIRLCGAATSSTTDHARGIVRRLWAEYGDFECHEL